MRHWLVAVGPRLTGQPAADSGANPVAALCTVQLGSPALTARSRSSTVPIVVRSQSTLGWSYRSILVGSRVS
jgi:hypothetical protein